MASMAPRLLRIAALLAAGLAATPARGQCRLPLPAESPHLPGVPFDVLAERAAAAAEGGRAEEAVRFYRAAVDLDPRWHDGWWRAAVLLSGAGCDDAARTALRHVITLRPQAGPGWALLGLSDFRLGSYETAFTYLSRGIGLGVTAAPEVGRQALHALTLLQIRKGDFPATAKNLTILSRIEPDDPELVTACGLVALRLPRLPSEVPAEEREVVAAAGRAGYALLAGRSDEGHRAFEALVARYSRARGVHFAYGLVLSREGSAEALPMLRQEVALFPDHGEAQLEMAFEILERGRPADALEPAREAARLLPESFWSHLALGRALLATGAVPEAVAELERANALAPEARDVYVVLAQAYARAGRPQDVERARARLSQLDATQQAGR
jgi:tetratricopeptide (TPR) repeat protein